MFVNIETQIHHRKNLILLEDIDIEKIRCSSMVSSGEKNRNILLVANLMIRKSNDYA